MLRQPGVGICCRSGRKRESCAETVQAAARRTTATKGAITSFMSALRYGKGSYGYNIKRFKKYVHRPFASFRMRKDEPPSFKKEKGHEESDNHRALCLRLRDVASGVLAGPEFWRTQSRPTKADAGPIARGISRSCSSGLDSPNDCSKNRRSFRTPDRLDSADYAPVPPTRLCSGGRRLLLRHGCDP